jgi:cytochrome c551/c552
MQHIRQLQLALSILLVALLLLIICGAVLILNYNLGAGAQVATNATGNADQTSNPATPVTQVAMSAEAKQGETIFNNNGCNACHSAGADVLVGPGLKGITQRRDEKWLVDWIHNSQKLIASGDKYAVDLYNKYNKTPMPSYESLPAEEIKLILTYIDGK